MKEGNNGGKRFNLEVISVLVALLVLSIVFMGGYATQPSTEEFAPSPPTTPITPGYIRVYNYKLGYGFKHPEDWETQTPEVTDGEDVESTEMFTKPGTPTTLIVTVKLSNLTSLEEVKGEIKEELNKLGMTILEEREIVVNDREGYEVIYKPIAAVKMRQVIFIANGKAYMLICSTAEPLYDEYEEIFDHVINSFVIE